MFPILTELFSAENHTRFDSVTFVSYNITEIWQTICNTQQLILPDVSHDQNTRILRFCWPMKIARWSRLACHTWLTFIVKKNCENYQRYAKQKSCDLPKMAASGSLFAGKKRTGSVLTSAPVDADGKEIDVHILYYTLTTSLFWCIEESVIFPCLFLRNNIFMCHFPTDSGTQS